MIYSRKPHQAFLSDCLIVMPFGLPYGWAADYELQTAKYLARSNTVIVYRINEGMTLIRWLLHPMKLLYKVRRHYVYTPLYLIPFQRVEVIKRINYLLSAIVLQVIIHSHPIWKNKKKIFWSFSLQHSVSPQCFNDSYFKIYDCVDAFTTGHQKEKLQWIKYETDIMRGSHVVFTNSQTLYKRKRPLHRNVFLVPEGMFIPELFMNRRQRGELTGIAVVPRPRVLYVGMINARLDFPLIRYVVQQLPRYSFIFIGKIDPLYQTLQETNIYREVAKLRELSNIYVFEQKPRERIAQYIRASDIGFIPYDTRQDFVRLSYPMKIQEYFFMGKPVVSSAILELKRLAPYVLTYTSPQEAVLLIRKLLSKPWSRQYVIKQKAIARSNSIDSKIRRIERVLATRFSHFF